MTPTPDLPSNPLAITRVEAERIEHARLSAAAVVARAHDLSVDDAEQAERAGGILRDLASVRKRADDERLELTKPLREKTAAINANYKAPSAMLDEADKVIRAKLLAYQREQARLRAEEQARLDAEAERQRLADEAAREADAAEARAQQEAWAAQQRELAEAAREAGDAKLAEAAAAAGQAADAMGDLQRARSIAPLPVHAPVVAPMPAKQAGIATRKVWGFKVIETSAVPPEFLIVDTAKLRKWMNDEVRAGRWPSMPGVKFEQEEGLSVRGR